jgi:hypothetical protein
MGKLLFLCLSISVGLAGCGKEKRNTVSVNQDGTCTGSYVDDFRELDHALKAGEATIATTIRQSAACQAFLSRHGDAGGCSLTLDGVRHVTIPEKIRENCDWVGKKMEKIRQAEEMERGRSAPPAPVEAPTPQIPETPTPSELGQAGDERALSSINPTKLKIRVIGETKIRTLLQNGGNLYLMRGQALPRNEIESYAPEMQAGHAVCKVMAPSEEVFIDGKSFSFSSQTEATGHAEGQLARRWRGLIDFETGLTCFNVANQPFKLRDIRAAFRGVFEITAEE